MQQGGVTGFEALARWNSPFSVRSLRTSSFRKQSAPG
ncbi:hypothetical protein V6L77_04395 [Pannonibacter sp. Pt2-lr]